MENGMSKPKVLLAEDDATMVNLLKTLLKMEGFDVVALQADADIPQAVRSEKPDVLLLDVHLSTQSGLDILERLRKAKQTNSIRVVMTSGANVKDECMRRGANGFLLKPYMPNDLINILKQALQSA
jgi:CheY-like chemotaxis protein